MASETKRALITGVTGQDGAYLAQLLLDKGYEVHGIKRRSSSFNTGRIEDIYQDPHEQNQRMILHYGDLTDATNLIRIVQEVRPQEIYNLAAQSHVQVSFETPEWQLSKKAARSTALQAKPVRLDSPRGKSARPRQIRLGSSRHPRL